MDGVDNSGRTYGDRLKEAMEAAGLKRADLARLLGVSYQSVRDAETGAFRPWNSEVAAESLGVAHRWLATGKGAMARDKVDLRAVLVELRDLLLASPQVRGMRWLRLW